MKKNILITGGGFAGYRLAQGLSDRYFDVTLISPRNHFLFTPLLPSTTVGTIEFRSIIEPLRASRKHLRYFQAAAESLDPEKKILRCLPAEGRPFDLSYDTLAICVGAAAETFGVPGVREHAVFLKELSDARSIRERIIRALERASLPATDEKERERLLHFVIVGGGPTGVEFAAELHDFIDEDLRQAFPVVKNRLKIIILEGSHFLLNSFDHDLSTYTTSFFKARKIEVWTSSVVAEVNESVVRLRDGTDVPYGVLAWTAGIGPQPWVRDLPFQKSKQGGILTDDYLRVLGHDSVYALGDCAAIQGQLLPRTGQLALQQGKYLARALNRSAKGRDVSRFSFHNMGMLAYIGDNRALLDLPHAQWRGFVAWLLWRSVYFTKLVGLRNKVRVLFDWTRTLLLGRDISSF